MRRHREHRVALVPLDDRPCNAKFPVRLGRMIDYEVVLPPGSVIGHFAEPGACEKVGHWLRSVAGTVDCAIVSADMLAYGSLVASRTPTTSLDLAAQRLGTLDRVRKDNPSLTIYAFSVLMRHGITVTCDATARLHEQLRRYSELAGLAEEGNSDAQAQIQQLQNEIDSQALADYMATRERNHRINRLCIEKVASGTVDFLVIPQEDASVQGVHRAEQRQLQARADELGVADAVAVYPGADEVGIVLLTRFAHEHMEDAPSVYVEFSDPDGAERAAAFEDRPVRETVNAQIAASGCRRAASLDSSQLALFVLVPQDRPDGETMTRSASRNARRSSLEGFVQAIRQHVQRDRIAAVADVAAPNSADLTFTSLLMDRTPVHLLGGYAAWNTAANSIGTALAQACMRWIALRDKGALELKTAVGDLSQLEYLTLFSSLLDSERAHLQFLFSRFVEDWAYQLLVRPGAVDRAAEKPHANIYSLGDDHGDIETFVRFELTKAARELFVNHFIGKCSMSFDQGDETMELVISELETSSVVLPWQRTFEVEADFAFSLQVTSTPGSTV